MKLTLVAIGQRPPAWASAAYDDFAKRFPPEPQICCARVKLSPYHVQKAKQALCITAR